MGCAAFGIWGQLVVSIPLPALRLLVAGGFAYIFGVPFFIYGEVSWCVSVLGVGWLVGWLVVLWADGPVDPHSTTHR